MSEKIAAGGNQSKFDELLVRLEEQKKHIIRRLLRWTLMGGGGVLFVIGGIFLGFFLRQYVSVFYFKNPPPASIAELLDDRPTGSMTFAEFFGHFGEATGGAINLMGLGGLMLSLLFVADQLEGERRARREQDMPVVFVAPRLIWALRGASAGRNDGHATTKLVSKSLILYLGFRNIGDSAATQIRVNVSELLYCPSQGRDITLEIPNLEEQLIEYLPGQATREDHATGSYQESMQWNLTEYCPNFLNAVFDEQAAGSEHPSIKMKIIVSFKTIRGAEFRSKGSAIWSPKQCRDVRDYKQPEFLREFAAARKQFEQGQKGLDKFFLGADDNPLVPMIEEH